MKHTCAHFADDSRGRRVAEVPNERDVGSHVHCDSGNKGRVDRSVCDRHQPQHIDNRRSNDDLCCQNRPRDGTGDVSGDLVYALCVVCVVIDGVDIE